MKKHTIKKGNDEITITTTNDGKCIVNIIEDNEIGIVTMQTEDLKYLYDAYKKECSDIELCFDNTNIGFGLTNEIDLYISSKNLQYGTVEISIDFEEFDTLWTAVK